MTQLSLSKLAIYILFIGLTFWLALHHEPWRDEADNWLMARDASLLQIIKITPDSGHPILWRVILKPFAVLNFPYFTQAMIHLLIIWTAGFLLIFLSPFPLTVCIAVLFSYFFSFEYSVVARNYAPGILGLFLYAVGRKKGKDSLIITAWIFICFSQVHFFLTGPALLFLESFNFWRHPDIKKRITFYAMVILFLLSLWMIWPTGGGQFSEDFFPRFRWYKAFEAASLSIFPFAKANVLSTVIALSIYVIMFLSIANRPRIALVYLFGISGILYVFVFKHYYPFPRHIGILFVFTIFCLWLELDEHSKTPQEVQHPNQLRRITERAHRIVPVLFLAVFLWNLPKTVHTWYLETTKNFSDARIMADFLIKHKLYRRTLACFPASNCTAVLAYLPKGVSFWYAGVGRFGTHMYWDKPQQNVFMFSHEQAFAHASRELPHWGDPEKGPLFLSNEPVGDRNWNMKLIFATKGNSWIHPDEAFLLYAPLKFTLEDQK